LLLGLEIQQQCWVSKAGLVISKIVLAALNRYAL
jgi:hypothetical protein